jgi:mRNA-degrading endonuclease RelE of RelBE toxin-antitoxin system
VTQVGIAKKFRADLAGLPGPIASKAALWLMDYMVDPDDARFEAHRVKRGLMPNLWTAKLDDSYRVIYRLDQDGVRLLLLCDVHDRAYRRAEKLKAVNLDGVVEVVEAVPGTDRFPVVEPAMPEGRRREAGRSFLAWTDKELEAAGIPVHALGSVRALDSDDELLDSAPRPARWGSCCSSSTRTGRRRSPPCWTRCCRGTATRPRPARSRPP